jgi:hypothetical protein
MRKTHLWAGRAMVAAVTFGLAGVVKASPVIDGTLSAGEGYALDSTQTNVTTSQQSDNGGVGGKDDEATASSTGSFTNLSNAYGQIDPSTNSLDLFIGGSIAQVADTKLVLAIQTNSNGVTSLANQTINGEAPTSPTSGALQDVMFSNGFAPTALFVIYPGGGSGGNGTTTLSGAPNTAGQTGAVQGVSYTDLTSADGSKSGTSSSASAPTSVTAVLDNALVNTPVGTGATGDPGFAGATTGFEISIPLATLNYTPGTSIEALAFPSVGSDSRTDNQILAPFSYGTDPNDYDYGYIGTSNNNNIGASTDGRQFVQAVYPGPGYFTVAVPEPTSLSLIALVGAPLLARRSRRRHIG